MNVIEIVLAVLVLVLAGGFLWAFVGWQKARSALATAEHRIELIEDSRPTMTELVKAQAAQSAQAVADQMVSRATETFRAQDQLARERMAAQLKPVADTLTKFQEHVAALEKTRSEETGGLREQLAALMAASSATRDEARKLTDEEFVRVRKFVETAFDMALEFNREAKSAATRKVSAKQAATKSRKRAAE